LADAAITELRQRLRYADRPKRNAFALFQDGRPLRGVVTARHVFVVPPHNYAARTLLHLTKINSSGAAALPFCYLLPLICSCVPRSGSLTPGSGNEGQS
jgi:hypothetical protein